MSDIYLDAENIMALFGMRNRYEDPPRYSCTKDALVTAIRKCCDSELKAMDEARLAAAAVIVGYQEKFSKQEAEINNLRKALKVASVSKDLLKKIDKGLRGNE